MKTISINSKKLGFKKNRSLKSVSSVKNYLLQKKSAKIPESSNEVKACYFDTLENIQRAEIFEYHRSISERQRLQYQKDKMNVVAGSIMIVCDWKEKIKIGEKLMQYNLQLCSRTFVELVLDRFQTVIFKNNFKFFMVVPWFDSTTRTIFLS